MRRPGWRSRQRQHHQHSIDREKNLCTRIDEQSQEVVRTARVVAELTDRDPRSEQHQQAKQAYERAKTTLQRYRAQLSPTAEANAQAALRADKKARRQHGADIDAGDDAELRLREQLYDRIGEAVGRGALLPMWFSTALGTTPPAARVEQWM